MYQAMYLKNKCVIISRQHKNSRKYQYLYKRTKIDQLKTFERRFFLLTLCKR